MLYAKIVDLDGDGEVVAVYASVEAAELELEFWGEHYYVVPIGCVEYDELLEELGYF